MTELTLPVKVNLYWDCFMRGEPDRQEELIQTFLINSSNILFDRIICYYSKGYQDSIHKLDLFREIQETYPNKIFLEEVVTTHAKYSDLFMLSNKFSKDYDINIIANNDIIFDNWDREKLNRYLRPHYFFTLSRLEILEKISGIYSLEEMKNNAKISPESALTPHSQDVWVWRGIMNPIFGHFPKGNNWGCDEVINYEAFKAGFFTCNPSILFKTYHNHVTGIRDNWPNGQNKSRHMYTYRQVRSTVDPYNPDRCPPPHPNLMFFDFCLPEYTKNSV